MGSSENEPSASPNVAGSPRRVARLRKWASGAFLGAVVGAVAWGSGLLTPGNQAAESESEHEWCAEHNVPEAICIECSPGLVPLPPDYGWCEQHGVHQCVLEHGELAQLPTPGTVSADKRVRIEQALALRARPENLPQCDLQRKRIQFASAESLKKAGITCQAAIEQPISETIVASGEANYDETRLVHLSSRVTGNVWRVEKQLGKRVKKGDVLALIDSSDIGKAKAELLQAITQKRLREANYNGIRPLILDGSIAKRQVREAEAALQEAEIRLQSAQQALINLGFGVRGDDFAILSIEELANWIRFLGIPDELTRDFSSESTTSNLFPLRAPLDGVVIGCKVVPGEGVDTSGVIFSIADTDRMWLLLSVRQDEAKYLAIGQPVRFRSSDSRDEPLYTGKLNWISTEADDQTRTVKVRVELTNTQGKLRAKTLGTGEIILREEPEAVLVPTEAIHTDGHCQVVFVRDRNFDAPDSYKFFHVRCVRTGVKQGELTEILVGLFPGEIVANHNSVILAAQLLKEKLGEGEACGH